MRHLNISNVDLLKLELLDINPSGSLDPQAHAA